MQYWNDLWNSAVCKSRRRLLSSNVAGRRYWFRAAAIIVRLRALRRYLRRDARGSFFEHVIFSYFRETPVIFLLYIAFYIAASKNRTIMKSLVHYQRSTDASSTRSNRVYSRISEKFVLFPLRVPRRCGWRIFKSATARENSCGNKYREIGGKRVSVYLHLLCRISLWWFYLVLLWDK